MRRATMLAAGTALVSLSSLSATAQNATPTPGFGPNPELPAPQTSLIPTVNIATVDRWADGQTPKAADGFTVTRFADGLDHPRWV
jgi:glucose/arabinose dehydrogenase